MHFDFWYWYHLFCTNRTIAGCSQEPLENCCDLQKADSDFTSWTNKVETTAIWAVRTASYYSRGYSCFVCRIWLIFHSACQCVKMSSHISYQFVQMSCSAGCWYFPFVLRQEFGKVGMLLVKLWLTASQACWSMVPNTDLGLCPIDLVCAQNSGLRQHHRVFCSALKTTSEKNIPSVVISKLVCMISFSSCFRWHSASLNSWGCGATCLLSCQPLTQWCGLEILAARAFCLCFAQVPNICPQPILWIRPKTHVGLNHSFSLYTLCSSYSLIWASEATQS